MASSNNVLSRSDSMFIDETLTPLGEERKLIREHLAAINPIPRNRIIDGMNQSVYNAIVRDGVINPLRDIMK